LGAKRAVVIFRRFCTDRTGFGHDALVSVQAKPSMTSNRSRRRSASRTSTNCPTWRLASSRAARRGPSRASATIGAKASL